MFPFHFLGLITLQFFALIGAYFFKAHVARHQLDASFQRLGKILVITAYVLIVLTIAHGVIYHVHHGCGMANHHGCMKMKLH